MISAVSVAELPKVAELIRTAVLQSIDATDLPMPDPMLNRTGRPRASSRSASARRRLARPLHRTSHTGDIRGNHVHSA